jgi:RNA recognition motif-containing protein
VNKKLYVGNLEYSITDKELEDYFTTAGKVIYSKVITGMDGRPRGFGFVEMETEEEAKNAMETLNQSSFKNRTIVVNEAKQMKNNRDSSGPRDNRGPRTFDRKPKDDLNSKLRELRKRFN